MELLSGLAAGESVNDNTSSIPSQHKKKHSFTHAFRRSSLFQPSTVKKTYVRPVSFVELSKRAAAPPRRGILLGYIKASWDGSGRGELVTVFNPKAKVINSLLCNSLLLFIVFIMSTVVSAYRVRLCIGMRATF